MKKSVLVALGILTMVALVPVGAASATNTTGRADRAPSVTTVAVYRDSPYGR